MRASVLSNFVREKYGTPDLTKLRESQAVTLADELRRRMAAGAQG